MSNPIGERLKTLRGQRSCEEVANAVKVSRSALSMYENGARVPRDEIKIALANYYHVTVQELFYAEERHEKCQT